MVLIPGIIDLSKSWWMGIESILLVELKEDEEYIWILKNKKSFEKTSKSDFLLISRINEMIEESESSEQNYKYFAVANV